VGEAVWQQLRSETMKNLVVMAVAVLLGAGCDSGTATSTTPAVLARWRSAGAAIAMAQTNAPVLKQALTLPESAGLGDRFATNLARMISQRSGGGLSEGALFPVVRAAVEHESAGEITTDGWMVAIRAMGLDTAPWTAAVSGWGKAGGTAPVTVVTNGWWMAASRAAGLARAASMPAATPGGLFTGELDLAGLPGGDPRWPRVSMTLGMSNALVRTDAILDFATAPLGELEAWKIPDGLIHDPVIRFSAARGIGPVVEQMPWLKMLCGGKAPGQVTAWAQPEVTFRNWFAVPVDDGKARITEIHRSLQSYFGTSNAPGQYIGRLILNSNRTAMAVFDLKACTPTMSTVEKGGQSFLVNGFFAPMRTTNPIPAELRARVERPEIAWYEWEITGESARNWNVLAQFNRLAQREAPNPTHADGLKWMMATTPKLGNAVTELSRITPTRYELHRKSDIGLNGLELVMLSRWLDGEAKVALPVPGLPSKNP